jgi:hypothetical protein
MSNKSSESTHLQNVTFELHYPASPFYPRIPVFAQFSGVLNSDDRLFVKLDSGSIPENSAEASIPIRGFFTIDSGQGRWPFSGMLNNNRIEGHADRS